MKYYHSVLSYSNYVLLSYLKKSSFKVPHNHHKNEIEDMESQKKEEGSCTGRRQ